MALLVSNQEIPGSGRSPGGGNGYPLQYLCLENSLGRGVWRATVHGVAELDMTEHIYFKWVDHGACELYLSKAGFGGFFIF